MSLELKTIKRELGAFEINYQEVHKELEQEIQIYKTMIVTDENLPLAKENKAKLNKLAKALSDWRISEKKKFMQPFEEVETQIKELDNMIKAASKNIDDQVKAYEERDKTEKLKKIKEIWFGKQFTIIEFSQIWNDKWFNKGYTLAKIEEEMNDKINTINNDLATIKSLIKSKTAALEVQSEYLRFLDLNLAVSNYNKREETKQKIEKASQDQIVQETTNNVEAAEVVEDDSNKIYTLSFRIKTTKDKIKKLDEFLHQEDIYFETI